MEYISKPKYDELTELLMQRRDLVSHQANTPIDFYNLKQKLLIHEERKKDVRHLTDKINILMQAAAV